MRLTMATELQLLSTTRLGIERLEGVLDTYQPRTLPPQFYQTNIFSRQQMDDEIGGSTHELTAYYIPATAEEIRHINDDELMKRPFISYRYNKNRKST